MNPESVNQLDLTGFRTRFPSRALRWWLNSLGQDEPLVIIANTAMGQSTFAMHIELCGGTVAGEEPQPDGTTRYTLLKRGRDTDACSLDLHGARCPVPVIEAGRRLRSMSPGERLWLTTDCTASVAEFNAWSRRAPHAELVGLWPNGAAHVVLLARR